MIDSFHLDSVLRSDEPCEEKKSSLASDRVSLVLKKYLLASVEALRQL